VEFAVVSVAVVEIVGADRIAINPDCGFAPNSAEPPSIDEAFEKLKRLVSAALMLRGAACSTMQQRL
jgi:methionine synthase II (cobalamin-independent)